MNHLLDDVRRDAIEKLRLAEDRDIPLLLDTIFRILSLQEAVPRDGLLIIESSIQDIGSELLKCPFLLIEDAVNPEDIIEISTNKYWIENPQGIHAMIAYACIRGALYIQSGKDSSVLQDILRSLIPPAWQQKYQEQLDRNEFLHKRQISEKFARITSPVFQESDVLINIDTLEKELRNLPDQSLQKLIRSLDRNSLAECVLSVHAEIREKIMKNLSERYANDIMELVIAKEKNYEYPSKTISEVLLIVNKLHDL